TPVAAAIEHATRVECDVITMSLGGPPSLAGHAAVRNAVAKGGIVLAAAGNCVRIVVYPARYDAVIAVAGGNVAGEPGRGWRRPHRHAGPCRTRLAGATQQQGGSDDDGERRARDILRRRVDRRGCCAVAGSPRARTGASGGSATR